jgi:two-component system, NarL family, invasion response regulator UvrY
MIAPGVTVLLVDDHAVVREGYRRLLERSGDITVVGEACDATQALARFSELLPQVVVLDISMPGVSGIEVLRRLLAREPAARVLMFSMFEEAVYASRALQAGAWGYVTKASAPDVLVEAVRSVAAGERYLSADIARELALRNVTPDTGGPDALSAREFEVLRLIVQGLSLKDIAERLGVHPKTIANHQSMIRQKLGADNPVQLLRIAARLGLTPSPPQ